MSEASDANAKAKEINSRLTVYDFSPHRWVHVSTDEGFRAEIPSALALQYNDWYMVFAEHHDPLVFHMSDIMEVWQYEVIQGVIPQLHEYKFKES